MHPRNQKIYSIFPKLVQIDQCIVPLIVHLCQLKSSRSRRTLCTDFNGEVLLIHWLSITRYPI